MPEAKKHTTVDEQVTALRALAAVLGQFDIQIEGDFNSRLYAAIGNATDPVAFSILNKEEALIAANKLEVDFINALVLPPDWQDPVWADMSRKNWKDFIGLMTRNYWHLFTKIQRAVLASEALQQTNYI